MGICLSCGTVACAECSTKIDGINHCAVCVADLTRDVEDGQVAVNSRPLWWLGVSAAVGCIAALGYGIFHMFFLW